MNAGNAKVLAVIVFGLTCGGLYLLTSAIGLELYRVLDEPYFSKGGRIEDPDEAIGHVTLVGLYIFFISGMIAWRLYHALISWKLFDTLTTKQNISWRYWIFAVTTFVVLDTIFWQLPVPKLLKIPLWMVLGIVTGIVFHRRYKAALKQ